jgi:hypothetical protein
MGVIMAGCRNDTIVKVGFMNDHTGVYEENTQAIKFTDYTFCRFKKLERFSCTLKINSNYNLLIIGIDSYYGLLFDLRKILATYNR